jgi:hypothetical protein
MAQEMQRLSDQSNAATMQTAQLKSQQALVGRLSELEYPAKAATAGLNEARANEEQSERSLRRSRTSSIESERLTRTHEGATDSSQYVLKESKKVATEVEQGAGIEACETLELPVADVKRPTRTLLLKNIPSSTTVSNLTDTFKSYGPIILARVLAHASCGFIRFERLESAISAKATLNYQEIFPGAGPVLIDFTETSPSGTSNIDNTEFPSPSLSPASSQDRFDDSDFKHTKVRNWPEIPGEAQRNIHLMETKGQYNQMSRMGKGTGAMVYGIVMYDFAAERPDELGARAGEAIIVIAQSNPEWFVAKPIGRLDGPGLIPVSFIEIRDMSSGQAVQNPQEAVQRAGVPTVEEWKKMAADYKNSSITLGKYKEEEEEEDLRLSLGMYSSSRLFDVN